MKYIYLLFLILFSSNLNAEFKSITTQYLYEHQKAQKEAEKEFGEFTLSKFLMSKEIYESINNTAANVVKNSFLLLSIAYIFQLLIISVKRLNSKEENNEYIDATKKFAILAFFLASYYYVIPWIGSIISNFARNIFPEKNSISSPLSDIMEKIYGEKGYVFFSYLPNIVGWLSFKLLSFVVSALSVILYLLQGIMYAIGAISIAISILEPFANSWKKWLSTFTIIGFWGVTTAIVLRILDCYASVITKMTAEIKPGFDFLESDLYGKLVIINIIIILIIIFIPKLTSCCIEANSSSIGEIGSAMTGLATAGAGLAMAGAKMGLSGGSSAVTSGAKSAAGFFKKMKRAQSIGKIMRG